MFKNKSLICKTHPDIFIFLKTLFILEGESTGTQAQGRKGGWNKGIGIGTKGEGAGLATDSAW